MAVMLLVLTSILIGVESLTSASMGVFPVVLAIVGASVLAVGALALDRKDPAAPTARMRQDAAQSPRHRQA